MIFEIQLCDPYRRAQKEHVEGEKPIYIVLYNVNSLIIDERINSLFSNSLGVHLEPDL